MTASGLHEANKNNAKTIAYELIITGMIQGVGFRPLIYRLAHEKNLVGWVKNDCGCVRIHIEGSELDVEQFSYELQNNASMVSLYLLEKKSIKPNGLGTFSIEESSHDPLSGTVSVPKDLYLCDACQSELLSTDNRRSDYSFIACFYRWLRFFLTDCLVYRSLCCAPWRALAESPRYREGKAMEGYPSRG